MSKRSVAGWMLVGTGIGIAATVLSNKNMKTNSGKAFKNSVHDLKNQGVSMIKDEFAEGAADVAKKTGNVLIKAGKNLDNSVKN